jgi:DHA2 family multidrug resistance protein
VSDVDPAKPNERAGVDAWLAVAAGTIGALMATLDISIVNTSLPTIQGAISASGSEGTWVSTAYLVAEIIMIPLVAWFTGILGLRRFLLVMTSLFVVFSIWCGLSESLVVMIIGRVGQGFTGGAMIPTALTIVTTRLPPRRQPVGLALFGMTAVLGPVLGPVVGGWLTETLSWHYVFFLNLPIGIGLLTLILLGLPHGKLDWSRLRNTDVLGLLGLVLALGALTVVLEEGERERWFESGMICGLSGVSVIGFLMVIAGQLYARQPIIRLKILLTRSFGSAFVLSLTTGAALYGVLYLVPQFLTQVPGYNPEQSGYITALSGIPMIVLLAMFPILVRKIDMRIAVAFGLFLYGASCIADSLLSPDTAGAQFVLTQIVRGFAQFFAVLFLNQAATVSVPREYAADASGLFNAARNLGGSFGLALISTLQDRRETLHVARLSESISANSVLGQDALHHLGVARVSEAVAAQAVVLTYADLYRVFGVLMLMLIPLAFLLTTLPKDADISMGH